MRIIQLKQLDLSCFKLITVLQQLDLSLDKFQSHYFHRKMGLLLHCQFGQFSQFSQFWVTDAPTALSAVHAVDFP